MGVRRKEGITVNFLGFREKDYEQLKAFCYDTYGIDLQEQVMSTSGRNWGSVAINGSSLMFLVDDKVAFEVPLPDVSQAQQSKDELILEFHVDDTAADPREDTLLGMSFQVPAGNQEYAEDGEDNTAKVLLDRVLQHTDTGAATSDDAVAIFDDVAVLAPRGRFEVEMHMAFLKLGGQSQDFKIRYTSIVRLFLLPKSNPPHTLVVISLDPPIRKGQTFYSHLLCQFPSHEEETELELDISDEDLAKKNEKFGGKLQREMRGRFFEVFANTLRGLSGAKITRPGSFRNHDDDCAVRCSYKADEGYLYPLEKAFFYIPKPPILVLHDEIESVEFQRQGAGVLASSVKTFDLVLHLKNGGEHQFRNIQRTEWQNLLEFIHAKRLRIENLSSAQQGPGGGNAMPLDVGDEMDPGLRAVESSEDEDFDAGDSDSESDSESGSEDAEVVDEEGITAADVSGKRRHADDAGPSTTPPNGAANGTPAKRVKAADGEGKAPKSKAKAKAGEDDDGGGGGAKKQRKKKDPNAPKRGQTAYFLYMNENRDKVKAANPGIAFGDVAKVVAEQWKSVSAEDKQHYEELAAADKQRYLREMETYNRNGGVGGGAAQANAGGDGGGDDGYGSEG